MNRVGIRGQEIDLYVQFVSAAGEKTNSDQTPQVEIYDSMGRKWLALTNVGVSLVPEEVGLYKLSYTIPNNLSFSDGYASDIWSAKIGNDLVTNAFDFLVTSAGEVDEAVAPDYDATALLGASVPWDFTKDEAKGVNILMQMLKCRVKNDGVRKVPDGYGAMKDEICVVFTNAEIICFLMNSLSEFNSYPNFTAFKFSDPAIYTIFADIIVQGGVLMALAAQALIERGREFVLVDSSISYSPPAISEILNTQYNEQLQDYKERLRMIKNNLKPAPYSIATFHMGNAMVPGVLRLRHLRQRQII